MYTHPDTLLALRQERQRRLEAAPARSAVRRNLSGVKRATARRARARNWLAALVATARSGP